jgi:hypothetical protein
MDYFDYEQDKIWKAKQLMGDITKLTIIKRLEKGETTIPYVARVIYGDDAYKQKTDSKYMQTYNNFKKLNEIGLIVKSSKPIYTKYNFWKLTPFGKYILQMIGESTR